MMIKFSPWLAAAFAVLSAMFSGSVLTARTNDPCGMVPPIYTGEGVAITRIGLQQTYVFFDRDIESFVIRPGFHGKVDNFGMLIPFPSPPAIRKVPDNVFDQIKNAVDPPEVVVNLLPPPPAAFGGGGFGGGGLGGLRVMEAERDRVVVHKQEAVGMYEVAVLSAGSAQALKRWMDDNGYQYPKGMDKVANEYVEDGWCFVAVKTKVGTKADVDPKPGQRNARTTIPAGGAFDGNVQGLGFRFRTEKLVVPMRLSAFNDGDLRNIVYLLTREPKKIRSIPEEYVMRQLPGDQLVRNLTGPLPLRVIGGTFRDIPQARRKSLIEQRDPTPHNGVAKHLFASDLRVASAKGRRPSRSAGRVRREKQTRARVEDLSLQFEEEQKELLRIGEHFGLRGADLDAAIEELTQASAEAASDAMMAGLKEFTLTVIDGDFPREVLANQNLTFARYKMPRRRNDPSFYDTKLHGPAPEQPGVRISAAEPWERSQPETAKSGSWWVSIGSLGLLLAGGWLTVFRFTPTFKRSS